MDLSDNEHRPLASGYYRPHNCAAAAAGSTPGAGRTARASPSRCRPTPSSASSSSRQRLSTPARSPAALSSTGRATSTSRSASRGAASRHSGASARRSLGGPRTPLQGQLRGTTPLRVQEQLPNAEVGTHTRSAAADACVPAVPRPCCPFAVCVQLTTVVDFNMERMLHMFKLHNIVLPLKRVGPLRYALNGTHVLHLDFIDGRVHGAWLCVCVVARRLRLL